MRCTLITQWTENGREQTLEHTFDQDRITIGRGGGNTCVLKDLTRVVSTKHAEAHAMHGGWSLIDVGSTNGTLLNGAKIASNQEHALHTGDRIRIGPYQLSFHIASGAAMSHVGPGPVQPSVPRVEQSEADAERLFYLMQRAYGDWDGSTDADREHHLDQVLGQAIEGYDDDRARAALQSLRTALGHSAGRAVNRQSSAPPPSVEPVSSPRHNRGRKLLADEAAKKVGERLALCASSLTPDQLASQVASVLQAVCVGLADAVRGRRAFQKEFEVEATRILAWTPNPIKSAEGAEEIASILLDPRSKGLSDEQATASLTEVFHDLTLHQLGLMAGFRECIRGLLKELDPAVLEKGTGNRPKRKGIGLLGGGTVRAEAVAWRRYKEKHQQLSEEEVKVFERILAPHFTKGYLSVHATQKRA